MEEPLIFSAWQAEINCDSIVVVIYGLQGLLATDPWGDSYMDAVGECLRFILFLDDLYARMSDRVFPKGSRTLISSNVL